MNSDLSQLQPYPFEKLTQLKAGITPPALEPIALSVGEPKHPAPSVVIDALIKNIRGVEKYPSTKGSVELREAIKQWLEQRFALPVDESLGSLDIDKNILPVTGTREALFAFAQTVVDRNAQRPLVLSPNPFYQIYEGAAYLAGAKPHYYPVCAENNYQADFSAIDEQIWRDCQLLYICTPGNPTGAVMPMQQLQYLIKKSLEFDFIIASDECYSEIYFDQPPVGLLQAAASMGHYSYKNCVVFHSLSKRSNLPGLRSGFVAGDAQVLSKFLQYRTYHGCAMPPATQSASVIAWGDEAHVASNRAKYRQKFAAVLEILQPVMSVQLPDASFYLWPQIDSSLNISDTEFAQRLYSEHNVTVLPGSFLSRQVDAVNPGAQHIRMALVAELENCIEAAQRIKTFVLNLQQEQRA